MCVRRQFGARETQRGCSSRMRLAVRDVAVPSTPLIATDAWRDGGRFDVPVPMPTTRRAVRLLAESQLNLALPIFTVRAAEFNRIYLRDSAHARHRIESNLVDAKAEFIQCERVAIETPRVGAEFHHELQE